MKKIVRNILLLAAIALPPATFAQSGCNNPLPWTFGFEGLATGTNSFVPCWTRVDSAVSGYAVYPNIFSTGSHGNVLNFNGNSATQNGTMRAATPLIPAPLNALEISFAMLKNTLRLYAATDPYNQSTYHFIGSYDAPVFASQWPVYEVRTDTIAGMPSTQGYLVFTANFSTSGQGNDNPYLDDLTIMALNVCQRTEFVRINNITPYTAALSWPGVDGRQGYRVSYNDTNDMATAITFDVPANSANLSGLTPGTDYYVWVQTVCDDETISDPRAASFTTQDACYPILNLEQISYTGTSAAFQWNYDGRGNNPDAVITLLRDLSDSTVADVNEYSSGSTYHIFTGLNPNHEYLAIFRTMCDEDSSEAVESRVVLRHCGESPLASGGNDYSHDCPISPGYDNSYSVMLYDADILYGMDTLRGIALHRSLVGSDAVRKLNIYIGHTTLDSLSSNPGTSALTQVATNHIYTLALQEWDTLLFDTPFVYDGSSNVLVSISDNTGSHSTGNPAQWYWHNADTKSYYSYGTSPMSSSYHRPDIRFAGDCQSTTCEAPVIFVSYVDSTFADVEWREGMADQWVLEYRSIGAPQWIVVDTVDNLYDFYTVEGLQPNSYYEVRIGALCSGAIRYSSPVQFITGCASMHLPFHFSQSDMGAAVTNGFTPCWSWSEHFYKGRLSTSSHRAYVRNAGNDEWFMLPPIAEPLQGARLRTWVASSDQGWFKVGIASESNCSDVVWVDTVEVPASNVDVSSDEYVVYLDSYTGTGNRVVLSPIVNNEYHYLFFYDFHLEPIEGCRPPVNLVLDSATANTLYISWTPVGAASEWAVYAGGVRLGTTTTPSYTVGGLDAYSYYDVQVRALCGEDDSSACLTGSFLTDCAGESCYFTIDARSASGDGWRGGHLVVNAGSQSYDFTMLRGHEEAKSYLVCNSDSVKFQWYSGNDDDVCSFVILGPAGDTLISIPTAYNLQRNFFAVDSLCGRPEPDPDPDPVVSVAVAEAAGVTLSPNPASSFFTLAGLESGSTVTLIDACGREVMRTTATGIMLNVSVDGFAKGVYFVRIANRNAAVTRKVVVR